MKKAARRIVEKLRLHGHEAFFAGGWARDHLLHRKPKDIDIATDARPDEVRDLFPKSRSVGAQFGVIQVPMYGHSFDVATFRSDNPYLDGRHPSSVTFSGPEQDALRRDFTINGLFYDPVADRLIDYVRGKSDINNRIIRTIGDPSARFAEDKLRMLRAIRFSCTLEFRIAPETWNAILSLAAEILQVSWERIRNELIQILRGTNPSLGLDLLHGSGLLVHILPEVEAMHGAPLPGKNVHHLDLFSATKNAMGLLRNPSVPLTFAALLHVIDLQAGHSEKIGGSVENHPEHGAMTTREVCRRLRISNEETDRAVSMVSTLAAFLEEGELPDRKLRRILRKPNYSEHLELFRVHCISNGIELSAYANYLHRIKEYEKAPETTPLIAGNDLIALGYSPGPIFSRILQQVEDLQLDGILHSHEEAMEYVRSVFAPSAEKKP
jgi:poly(A) polymerase